MPTKRSPRKPDGYWNDFANVERELLQFNSEHGSDGIMPTQKKLRENQQHSLGIAIQKHGGFHAIAKKLGLKSARRKPNRYWGQFENIRRELFSFIRVSGTDGIMPTQKELREAHQGSLGVAIQKHGGFPAVAERLGLKFTYKAKPYSYWDQFENLKLELTSFVRENGIHGQMPTPKELERAGRSDLANAISEYGGYVTVSQRLGLMRKGNKKPFHYWDDFGNVEKELIAFIADKGKEGVMPTWSELVSAGRGDLVTAITTKHGGIVVVAKRLGLERPDVPKPQGYWSDFKNLQNELQSVVAKHNLGNVMPVANQLRAYGRSDLIDAINKHGGFAIVAEKMGLIRLDDSKPRGYWDDFGNVELEIHNFIIQYGKDGVMPSSSDLDRQGRGDLERAIENYGGLFFVARKLGLNYQGVEHITFPTASSVERTVRAIQPLAESNLLSPSQIMLILRRAGLLDFRNPRVVKLSAGLARGNHSEIERALSDLVNSGEKLPVESVDVQETDVLTSEVAQALLSSEALAPPLRNPAEPHTQLEQAIIRGLSALGELRLPLDEVLQLLTSKVLWENFYKRLYHWYGSLDAAQMVTAQDVDAAVLASYPEHTANEFVAEASAIFALEVEQAINFAAELPFYGWQGPRLRLHQADAARRMSVVLQGSSGSAFLLDADDPGMGKSASFLAAVAVSGIQSVVLIAPKTVADDTWGSANGEIRHCLPHAKIVRGLDASLAHKTDTRLTFYLLHYEELLNNEKLAKFASRSFDCLCLDEIHFVKQRAGQELTHRRAALQELRASARTAIGLTGTPLVNELSEPMSLLQVLSQNDERFDHSRLSNRRLRDIADVFEALLPHIVRRRKREVLLHLPDCDIQTVDIPLPDDLERRMLQVYGWPRARASEALVELRKIATEAKLPYLLSRAETGPKLLILTYLTDDVSERIFNYLDDFLTAKVAHINGEVPKAERERILNSFRKPNGASVLVGTIGTIGVGITLFDPKQADTAHEVIFADLPYTYAEFEQGLARLHREGQKQRVQVDVLQTVTASILKDGSAHQTLDERIWALIESKRELSDVAVDGKYDTTDAADKVLKALRRWLKQAREIGVEPLAVERRPVEQSPLQRWRGEIGRLRGMSASRADDVFADPDYTRQFLAHLEVSSASKLSHAWLHGRLVLILRPELTLVDMGCGLNPFADLPCKVIGLDRHNREGQLKGKMENPPLPDKSADVLIYSLSLYGTSADLFAYFSHAARILRGGGHLFIVEPSSSFSESGLAKFIKGLKNFGFELVGSVKELRGEEDTLLKAMHFTLTGERNEPSENDFERN